LRRSNLTPEERLREDTEKKVREREQDREFRNFLGDQQKYTLDALKLDNEAKKLENERRSKLSAAERAREDTMQSERERAERENNKAAFGLLNRAIDTIQNTPEKNKLIDLVLFVSELPVILKSGALFI
jgi:hypothetical protein